MQRTVKGVEVYEVGKCQLWEWCDWMGCGDWQNVRVFNYADSLAKDRWAVVEGTVQFGRCARPNVVTTCTSLRKALELVSAYVEYDKRHAFDLYDEHFYAHPHMHEYEVWHIVDDYELWGEWELDAQESLQCHECGARLNDDNMVCYDVDLVCEKCHDKRLDATIESTRDCDAFRGVTESRTDDAPHDDVVDYGEDTSKTIHVDLSNMALAQSVKEEYDALTGIEREFSYFLVECDSYMEEQACKLEFLMPADAVLCAVSMVQSTFVPSVTIKLFVCCERVERGSWEVFPHVPTV